MNVPLAPLFCIDAAIEFLSSDKTAAAAGSFGVVGEAAAYPQADGESGRPDHDGGGGRRMRQDDAYRGFRAKPGPPERLVPA